MTRYARRILEKGAGVFLAILTSLCTTANRADEPPSISRVGLTLTNAIQIRQLPIETAKHSNPVHLHGVVTYEDFEWNMLFVQDSTAGIYLSQAGEKKQFKPGQRVEVEGFTDPGNYTPIVSRARVTVTGEGPLPKPTLRSPGELANGAEDGNWVEVTGVVRSAAVQNGHLLMLQINTGKDWIKASVRAGSDDGLRNLVNARVRVQGVCTARANELRELIGVQLFVPSLAFVSIEESPMEDEFALPIRTSAELVAPEKSKSPALRVHVQGVVQPFGAAKALVIRDRTGSIGIETSITNDLAPGLVLDVVGSSIQGKAMPALSNVKLRRIGIADPNDFAPKSPARASAKVLTSVQEIRALKPEDAALGLPVRVRGVVTFYDDSEWGTLFVQDSKAGIYVDAHGHTLDLELGQWIDLEGVTAPGDFAPIITQPRFTILGRAPVPTARSHSLNELNSGKMDSQWLQMNGIVHSAEVQNGHLTMGVVNNGGDRFEVVIPRFLNRPVPTHLIDSEVRLDGVCGTIFNQKRQLVGVRLFVPSLEFVTPQQTAPSDPYTLPIRSIDSLSRFNSAEETDHRLRVQGTVTFFRPKEFFFVQDDRSGLLVKTEQTGSLEIGDRVDVVGFAATGNYTPVLTQAIYRKTGAPRQPATPVPVAAEQALSADFDKDIYDARLIRLRGRLLEVAVRSQEKTLVLQAGAIVFNAYLTDAAASQFCASLRTGSLLEVTGVCSVQVDSSRYPKSFDIYSRSSNDITVLATPSWWNVRHTMSVAAALGAIVLLTFGWILALRRRVQIQTALIQNRLERERALEVRYRDLFDANPHPMWVYDTETLGFLAVNDAAVHHYGYSREAFLQMTIKEIRPADDVGTLIERLDSTRGEPIQTGTRSRHCRKNGCIIDVEVAAHQFVFAGRKSKLVLVTDVTERLRAEAEMEALNKRLIESSRQAGMAEVATGVLHNVGNVLNSVNVSATLVSENLRKSRACNLSRVTALFEEHAADVGSFLTSDPKGRRLPAYLGQLARHLEGEQADMLKELELLRKNVEHIKDIVSMQQSYAKVCGVSETVRVVDLLEDTLRMNTGSLVRHEVQVIREYDPHLTDITTEKHKVLQILVNLVRNAKYACDESGRNDKRVTLRASNGGSSLRIAVIDNGVGIPPENLTRIFNHGYTTRKDGHGFGLHSGALAARELGGRLTAHSDGSGRGATFTLELPLQPRTTHA